MNHSADHRADAFSVLLEHESGVSELFLTRVEDDNGVGFKPLGAILQSGELRPTTPVDVMEAVKLLRWSEDHPEVFEGRVARDE